MAAPKVTLEQWRTLAAVVDGGSYANAASALHKSQSAVSYAVQQLESQLGVKAFEIEGRKAKLTSTGELLYRRARYLLEEAEAIEQAATRLSAGWEPEIRLAVEIIFPTWILLGAMDKLGRDSPGTRIELIESVLGHRTDALVHGQADLAIFASVPPGFFGERLMQLRFVLVAAPSHPLRKLKRKLTRRDLRAHRHLVVRESSPDRSTPPSIDATQRWTVSHPATEIEALRAGYGYAWMPEDKVARELETGELARLELREGGDTFTDLYLIFADREHAGPATLRLAEILREDVAAACKAAGR